MMRICIALLLILVSGAVEAEDYKLHSFQKTQLSDQFFCEGASFGDFNRDGSMDIVSGPYWYAGPKFTERFEFYPPKPFDIANYSDNFFAFSHDVDQDGWQDIVVIGFPGENTWWFQNPQGKSGHWQRHVALPVTDNESPTFTDITGDGRPDLVCSTGGQMGYAEIPQDDPKQPWKFRAISPNRGYQRYTHGMGVGDVNGDGRQDVLEKNGWYEQPGADAKTEFWTFHEVPFAEAGGAQMLVYDVDGDGDNDVVTSKAAHAYGLSWFEHEKDGDGAVTFREHPIMGERPEQNDYGVVFSQLHALALADMDGDGVQDVVTGKRFWAHRELDPGSLDPAVLYWFRTVREGGKARFIPYRIDNNSGVGTQVVAGDINGDKWPDIVVGSKKGTFVLTHQVKDVDEEDMESGSTGRKNRHRTSSNPAARREPAVSRPQPPMAACSILTLNRATLAIGLRRAMRSSCSQSMAIPCMRAAQICTAVTKVDTGLVRMKAPGMVRKEYLLQSAFR